MSGCLGRCVIGVRWAACMCCASCQAAACRRASIQFQLPLSLLPWQPLPAAVTAAVTRPVLAVRNL
jgi:hypothetical protein